LASILKTVKPILSENGLAIMQSASCVENGVEIKSILFHKSGQMQEFLSVFPANTKDIQKVGAAISYGRRYEFNNILNICPDDDIDGAREVISRRFNFESIGHSFRITELEAELAKVKKTQRSSIPPQNYDRPAVVRGGATDQQLVDRYNSGDVTPETEAAAKRLIGLA